MRGSDWWTAVSELGLGGCVAGFEAARSTLEYRDLVQLFELVTYTEHFKSLVVAVNGCLTYSIPVTFLQNLIHVSLRRLNKGRFCHARLRSSLSILTTGTSYQ